MTSPENAALVPGSLGDHALCMLQKLGQVAFRITEEKLAELGLRIRHYSVLQALADLGGASQTELCAYLRIDAATMVAVVDELQKLGAVIRGRDPHDRRRYRIELTESGDILLRNAIDGIDATQSEALADLTSEQQQSLIAALAALNTSSSLAATFERSRRVSAAS